jgi:hypothetical protein|tara:strand:- start:794 stop:1153 length:360 start_codon:yes stop_codon:yes gene_type:complete
MTKPIYANQEHEVIVSTFLFMVKDFVKEVSNETRWNNYLDILESVIEYHNNSYCGGTRTHSYWDWLMILPINVSVLTNGYMAAIETKGNASKVSAYKLLINELLQDVVDKIERIEPVHE